MPDNEFVVKHVVTGLEKAANAIGGALNVLGKKTEKAGQRVARTRTFGRVLGAAGAGAGVGTAFGAGLGPVGAVAGAGIGALGGLGFLGTRALGPAISKRVEAMSYAMAQTPVGRLLIGLEKLRLKQLAAQLPVIMGRLIVSLPKLALGFAKLGAALSWKVIKGLTSLARGALRVTAGAVGLPFKALRGVAGKLKEALTPVFSELKKMFSEALGPAKKLLSHAFKGVFVPFQRLFIQMAMRLRPLFRRLAAWTQRFVMQYGPQILQWTSQFAEKLAEFAELMLDATTRSEGFGKAFEATWRGIMSGVQAGTEYLYKSLVKPFFKAVAKNIGDLWYLVRTTSIFQWISDQWAEMMRGLRLAFSYLWNFILEIPFIGKALQGLGFGKVYTDLVEAQAEAQWKTIKRALHATVMGIADGIDRSMTTAFEYKWTLEDRREREKETRIRRGAGIGRVGAIRAEEISAISRPVFATAAMATMTEEAVKAASKISEKQAKKKKDIFAGVPMKMTPEERTAYQKKLFGADIQFGQVVTKTPGGPISGEEVEILARLSRQTGKDIAEQLHVILKMATEEREVVWSQTPVGEPDL